MTSFWRGYINQQSKQKDTKVAPSIKMAKKKKKRKRNAEVYSFTFKVMSMHSRWHDDNLTSYVYDLTLWSTGSSLGFRPTIGAKSFQLIIITILRPDKTEILLKIRKSQVIHPISHVNEFFSFRVQCSSHREAVCILFKLSLLRYDIQTMVWEPGTSRVACHTLSSKFTASFEAVPRVDSEEWLPRNTYTDFYISTEKRTE